MNLYQNTYIFVEEIAFENIVYKMMAFCGSISVLTLYSIAP